MATYDITNASNLFKIKYAKLADNVYNAKNLLLSQINKDYDFVGRQMFIPVPHGFSGGVGANSLPVANYDVIEDAIITSKKLYAKSVIDREAVAAASKDEGAFVRLTKYSAEKAVESFMRNMSRVLFNDGTGSLARGDGATNVSGAGSIGSPYLVTLNADTKEANVEEKDFWNYSTETTTLEVVAYNPTTKVVSLVGTSAGLAALTGVGPVPTGTYFYMQGSKDNDPEGIKGVLDATSGTKYTVPITRRFQATQKAAAGAGIIPDLLNEQMLEVQRKTGKSPNMIVTSYTQYRKLANILEDQKHYVIEPKMKELKGKISFTGLEFMGPNGPIGIFPERFVEADRVYLLNSNYITMYHRPGSPGWVEEDGSVFLRDHNGSAATDTYSCFYASYCQLFVIPTYHAVITGLST